jgi:uncharacterized protein with HEPN domain
MKPSERDAAHLWDMLDAARRVEAMMRGVSFDALMADERTRLAIERLLEIIGEAAGRVSADCRRRQGGIPWAPIIGFRNVLAHEYGEINYGRLYAVVTKGVPELIREIEGILGAHPGKPLRSKH